MAMRIFESKTLTSVDAGEAFAEVNKRGQSGNAPFASVFGIGDLDKGDVQVVDLLVHSLELSQHLFANFTVLFVCGKIFCHFQQFLSIKYT